MRWQTRKSGRVKDAQPEQVEAGAAIHLSLDQLTELKASLERPLRRA